MVCNGKDTAALNHSSTPMDNSKCTWRQVTGLYASSPTGRSLSNFGIKCISTVMTACIVLRSVTARTSLWEIAYDKSRPYGPHALQVSNGCCYKSLMQAGVGHTGHILWAHCFAVRMKLLTHPAISSAAALLLLFVRLALLSTRSAVLVSH